MPVKQLAQEQDNISNLSQEAMQILDILDQIENHTAVLRKKLMSELRPKNEVVHLELDSI